jgi:hypothetical protein
MKTYLSVVGGEGKGQWRSDMKKEEKMGGESMDLWLS